MPLFVSPTTLVTVERPIILGYIDAPVVDSLAGTITTGPLLPEDVESITYSLFRRERIAGMAFVNETTSIPVEEQQGISVENSCVTALQTLDANVYETIGVSPFPVNFIFIPASVPVMFPAPGTYVIRFEITAISGEMFPSEIEIPVR